MTLRRHLLICSAFALAASVLPAAAQDWPERPVRILVSFPPGGSSDLVARLVAEHLGARLGQPFVVENRPGAGGTVAALALREASADGHTFMLSNLTPFSIAPTLFPDAGYNPVTDFTHVSYIGGVHLALFAGADLGIDTLDGLISQAKAEPGMLDYGTSGVGSWGHIVSARFAALSGTEMAHIPYQGSGPMQLDLRAGVIGLSFDAVPQNLPLVAEGVAVPLAVSAPARLDTLPDVPTFREAGLDLVAENWLGLSAPAGLDPAIALQLDEALTEILATPEITAQFDSWGIARSAMDGAAFSAFVSDQYAAWTPMVEAAR
ncbi:Bug family tripartite tricarboxylate transporter substrate binding protein [Roseicitreum antarcticum]|uniref:Tripartite-type tricarboxylate transporter, receptor component TctC n=1 Tax=Roseicitreum antarcticum TaxID=564137 RepID=A0A1H2TMR9_9RHOB|nr:tripartite tricarboxylate transporter substrate binding protein [Roseicitreum antarcticum]SDW44554.1 Tripartite-type tricarboxylate transporter, receptor component TctC [Roseicitreum antarcticum]